MLFEIPKGVRTQAADEAPEDCEDKELSTAHIDGMVLGNGMIS